MHLRSSVLVSTSFFPSSHMDGREKSKKCDMKTWGRSKQKAGLRVERACVSRRLQHPKVNGGCEAEAVVCMKPWKGPVRRLRLCRLEVPIDVKEARNRTGCHVTAALHPPQHKQFPVENDCIHRHHLDLSPVSTFSRSNDVRVQSETSPFSTWYCVVRAQLLWQPVHVGDEGEHLWGVSLLHDTTSLSSVSWWTARSIAQAHVLAHIGVFALPRIESCSVVIAGVPLCLLNPLS